MVRRAYDLLRERANETRLPFDDFAERGAIGAVLVAPHDHAKRLVRRMFQEHFYLDVHGWLWARMSYALWQSKVDWSDNVEVYRWIRREKLCGTCYAKFSLRISDVVRNALEAGFWWHGDYYCDRVLAASRIREKFLKGTRDVEAAIGVIEAGWKKGSWK